MKSVPRFLRGLFRNALKLALHEATRSNDQVDQEMEVVLDDPKDVAPQGALEVEAFLEAS